MLKIPFFTAYTNLSTYLFGIYCFRALSYGVWDQETILINHERPHILLFVLIRRREATFDRCLVDCHIFFFLLMKMVNESFFMFAFLSPSPLYQVNIIIIATARLGIRQEGLVVILTSLITTPKYRNGQRHRVFFLANILSNIG